MGSAVTLGQHQLSYYAIRVNHVIAFFLIFKVEVIQYLPDTELGQIPVLESTVMTLESQEC